ncbi:MAG: polyphosphate polymerase domain-containing protein, partial [Anaerolineae bacterium]|nr:polyphosphate polymerase domain-containing protein [Anaerolineae bacterium]
RSEGHLPDLRYELKLLCPAHMASQTRMWMRHHPAGFRVSYPQRRVNNIYLDTARLNMLTANLDGLAVRSKLRLRWYGDALTLIHPHLELKHRNNLLGSKEQIPLSCDLDLSLRWTTILSNVLACLEPSWRLRFQSANQPTLLNRYLREYYVTPDGEVRVTLDTELTAYDQRFCARPNTRCKLPIQDIVVIEIKADEIYADRVQEIANAFPISRTRNSKYAKGMLAALYSQ